MPSYYPEKMECFYRQKTRKRAIRNISLSQSLLFLDSDERELVIETHDDNEPVEYVVQAEGDISRTVRHTLIITLYFHFIV